MGEEQIPFARIAASMRYTTILVVTLTICNGCAARRTSYSQPYRLVETGGTDFLLPPDFSPDSKNAIKTPVPLGRLNQDRLPGKTTDCSVRGKWFSFFPEGKRGGWVAQLPAPDAWYDNELVAHSREQWGRFINRIYDLKSKSCITPEGYEKATDRIRESMPAPAELVFFFRDPLDDRGFVTLGVDSRVFVERSIFRSPGAETAANYAGDIKTYYSVDRRGGTEIGLKLEKTQRSARLPRSALRGLPDAELAHVFGRLGALRLFLFTHYVPPGLTRTALLIGVQNPSDMTEISRRIEKAPEIPCKDLASPVVKCISFEGEVSASAEVRVEVNGKQRYFPIASSVDSVLSSLSSPQRALAWKTLRIRRLFRGKLYEVEFRRDDPEVHKLTLLAGDRISWGSKPISH